MYNWHITLIIVSCVFNEKSGLVIVVCLSTRENIGELQRFLLMVTLLIQFYLYAHTGDTSIQRVCNLSCYQPWEHSKGSDTEYQPCELVDLRNSWKIPLHERIHFQRNTRENHWSQVLHIYSKLAYSTKHPVRLPRWAHRLPHCTGVSFPLGVLVFPLTHREVRGINNVTCPIGYY